MTEEELDQRRASKAAYMRDYWKRNPEKYQAMLVRQRPKQRARMKALYQEQRDDPGFKARRARSNAKSHEKHARKRNDRQAARTYGITPEEYVERRKASCAICGRFDANEEGKRGQGMHVDHDHDTGELRGTLCPTCNRGLGSFKDDPKLLVKAAAYLYDYEG